MLLLLCKFLLLKHGMEVGEGWWYQECVCSWEHSYKGGWGAEWFAAPCSIVSGAAN